MKIEGTEITQIFLTESNLSVKPVVLRDNRGRIQWRLNEDSEEENLQIAIRNMQGLFLDKYPEFNARFIRLENGKITTSLVDEARQFIIDRVGSATKIANLSSSVINRQYVPYFEGSYVVAVQKSFEPWGIDFSDLRRRQKSTTKKVAHYWNEQTLLAEARAFLEQEGNLEYPLLRDRGRGLLTAIYIHYPGGLRGLRDKLGLNSENKPNDYWTKDIIAQEALNFISSHDIITGPLLRSEGRGDLAHAISRHYPGKMVQLKLDLKEMHGEKFRSVAASDPRPPGYWTPENILSEARFIYQQEEEFSTDVLARLGRGDLKAAISRYPGQVMQLLLDVGVIPKGTPYIGKGNRGYEDPEGRNWAHTSFLAEKFGITENTIRSLIKQCTQIEGWFGGRKILLYLEQEVEEILAEYAALPIADDNGTYADENGDHWIPKGGLARRLSISPTTVDKFAKQIRFLPGRSGTGKSVKLYHKSELVRILAENGLVDKKGKTANISPDEANEQLRRLLEEQDEHGN